MPNRPRLLVLNRGEPSAEWLAALDRLANCIVTGEPAEFEEWNAAQNFSGVIAELPGDQKLLPASHNILNELPFGVAILDEHARLRWFNRMMVRNLEQPIKIGEPMPTSISESDLKVAGCSWPIRRSVTVHDRQTANRGLELVIQPIQSGSKHSYFLVVLHDVTNEGVLHEKLLAVHRAGQELARLSEEELSRMSTAERIALLKANIYQYSQRILNFQNLEVRLLDPKTRKLNILLSEGMTAFDRSKELYAFETDNGVTGYVAATGRSYVCNDVKADTHYIPGLAEARSSLTVPLIYGDQVIGVFNVESTSSAHFTRADQQFLEIFCREIAAAIHTLDLLQAEKQLAGTASVEEVLSEVGIPADDIQSDASTLLELIKNDQFDPKQYRVLVRKMFEQARAIKVAIGRIHSKVEAENKNESTNQHARLRGKRVLLADAEVATRRSAHHLLQKLGLEVDTVRSGSEAVRQVAQLNYDVIMGDIRLPDMNGYEFFKSMQQAAPKTPLVLITGFGYDAQHSMVKARSEGQNLFLFKPFRIDRLREAVESALQLPAKPSFNPNISNTITTL